VNKLSKAVSAYITMRHQLGYKLTNATCVLNRFVAFMAQKKKNTIKTKLVLEFITQDGSSNINQWTTKKIGIIRRFAIFQHAMDLRTEIPPPHLLQHNYSRRTPYIFTENEIDRLLKAVSESVGKHQLADTFYTFFGLIAVTGMRISEAILLNNESVDLSEGVLEIRYTKFQKTRKLPLHPTTTERLRRYVRNRDRHYCLQPVSPFFVNSCGGRLNRKTAQNIFRKMCLKANVGREKCLKPRILDFRHSFAVRNLLRCYLEGLDVDQTVAILSRYLGHENPEYTYWYLTATPELLSLINLRSEKKYWRT
jgi:integrase/recombinase XerD